jgi:hypothetical protein
LTAPCAGNRLSMRLPPACRWRRLLLQRCRARSVAPARK